MPPIRPGTLPGATIGILGGGQLGRMAAMAARTLGYQVHALDPDPSCAARGVVDRLVVAPFDDPGGAAELAAACQVVTLEIEKIAPASMAAASAHCPVRPGAAVLRVVQDRALQKQWLAQSGFPVGPFRVADTAEALAQAVRDLGGACFVKSRTGGYDGRGQIRVDGEADLATAFSALGPSVVEQALDLEVELSVLVARSPGGEMAVYPPALNHHEQRILDWSVIPGPFPPAAVAQATEMARDIAAALGAEGLLAVEIFLTRQGAMLVNELSPRPHNTFHGTFLSCLTDQFEQLVRAVCDLPLGSVEVVRPAAIVNLLGDLWLRPEPPDFARALALPGVRLHLYGKGPARPGRKMGHLSAVGPTPGAALELVRRARALL
jgi:5-(carboxyamino)imidazole ribonucleotide synthase